MSQSKPILPTIISSVGMLFGGLLGVMIGLLTGSEKVVMTCFALGFIAGSIGGAQFGWRWHQRRERLKKP